MLQLLQLCLVVVPALATPLVAALHQKETIARPLTEIASVVQTVMCMVIAVKMFTALHVINNHNLIILT